LKEIYISDILLTFLVLNDIVVLAKNEQAVVAILIAAKTTHNNVHF